MRGTPGMSRTLAGALLVLCGPSVFAAGIDVSACTTLKDPAVRLACYDRAAGVVNEQGSALHPPSEHPPATSEPTRAPRAAPALPPVGEASRGTPTAAARFDLLWELDPAHQQGTFGIRAHRPTYFMPFKYTTDPNERPFQGAGDASGDERGLDRIEAKFQLSFKSKLAQNLFDDTTDLWFGYTQTSNWQMYNHRESSPFRNTDYSAELMMVHRPGWEALGVRTRFVNLGFEHQSNGRGEPLSRSWNRIYLQAAFQHEDFVLLLKPWYRVHESARHDDNPDINDRVGRGEVQALYFRNDHHFSLTIRDSFKRPHRGSLRGEWAFPLVNRLRGYVQIFSGYGESLIDYDVRQHAIGVGVMLGEGM